MAVSVPSHATAEMLEWARKKSKLSKELAAEAFSVSIDVLEKWENGSASPTFAQLKKLAKKYKYPVMVFYLESPPVDFQVVRDFRTVSSESPGDFSSDLTFVIRSAQERQAWASVYLQEEGFPEFAHIGTISERTPPVEAGAKIRKLLNYSLNEQMKAKDEKTAFANWKKHCEDLGIFVFTTSKLDVGEMRGFALPDKFAPTVVVNSHDADSAKIFTLLHEVVHIFLGASGVSGQDFSPYTSKPMERYCNRVSAEIVVPDSDFRSRVPSDWQASDDYVISALAKRYRVSRLMILLRLVETGFATREYYNAVFPRYMHHPIIREKQNGGPEQHILAVYRNGESFSKLALSAFHSGEIQGAQLASLLGMRLQHLPSLESRLSPMRIQRAADPEAP